jgi:hypothetical protein
VTAELEQQLTAKSEPGLAPSVPKTVAFQTTKNFSNKSLAGTTVEAAFDAGALTTLIRDKYEQGLVDAEHAAVAVAGLGDVAIEVKRSVRDTTKTGGAQAGAAATAVSSAMGDAGHPVNFFGFVFDAPPSGLIGKLMGIPATWGTAGSALETGVTAAAFSAKMSAVLKAVGAAAAIVAMLPGMGGGPKIARMHALYVQAHEMVNSAAGTAARQLADDLLASVVPPVITAGVTDLQASIHGEVEKIMGTPPSGLAAAGDPSMTAMVTAMKARLDADKAASAGGGRDPVGTGKAAPDQDVIYDYQGLMGSNATTAIRPDQLNPLLAQFNDKCRNMWEKSFTVEVK